MGQHDPSFGQPSITADDNISFETRELAWELTQPRVDGCRVRYLIETGADIRGAMLLARLTPPQVMRDPHLRPELQRYLATDMTLSP